MKTPITSVQWQELAARLEAHPVLHLETGERLYPMDLTASNTGLSPELVNDTDAFSAYITQLLKENGCRFGIGGYNEHRTIYARSAVFDGSVFDGKEPRRLHLGIDIWGAAGTPVFLPLDGAVHSAAFNDAFGDYGATLIVEHTSDMGVFHTLYGHISLGDIQGVHTGQELVKGTEIAHFGMLHENGHWPPHLHFQVILDMQGRKGDYPGVCRLSEKEEWLANSPDPYPLFSTLS